MMSPIFNESRMRTREREKEQSRTRWSPSRHLFLEDSPDHRITRLRPRGRGRKILIIAGRKISPVNSLSYLIARRDTKHIGFPIAFSHCSFDLLLPTFPYIRAPFPLQRSLPRLFSFPIGRIFTLLSS